MFEKLKKLLNIQGGCINSKEFIVESTELDDLFSGNTLEIKRLFQVSFQNIAVTIKQAKIVQNDINAKTIIIAGFSDVMYLNDVEIEAKFVINDAGKLEIYFRYTLIKGDPYGGDRHKLLLDNNSNDPTKGIWNFSHSFPQLPQTEDYSKPYVYNQMNQSYSMTKTIAINDLKLFNSYLVVTNMAGVKDSVFGVNLKFGINFVSNIYPTGMLGILETVFEAVQDLKGEKKRDDLVIYGTINLFDNDKNIDSFKKDYKNKNKLLKHRSIWHLAEKDLLKLPAIILQINLASRYSYSNDSGSIKFALDKFCMITPLSSSYEISDLSPKFVPNFTYIAKGTLGEIDLNFMIPLSLGKQELTIIGDFENLSLENIGKLVGITGESTGLEKLLPEQIRDILGKISLTQAMIVISFTEKKPEVTFVSFTVGFPALNWNVADFFEIKDLMCIFDISYPFHKKSNNPNEIDFKQRDLDIMIYGNTELKLKGDGGETVVPFTISAGISDDFTVYAQLSRGSVVSLKQVIQTYSPDFQIDTDLTIDVFRVSASKHGWSMALALAQERKDYQGVALTELYRKFSGTLPDGVPEIFVSNISISIEKYSEMPLNFDFSGKCSIQSKDKDSFFDKAGLYLRLSSGQGSSLEGELMGSLSVGDNFIKLSYKFGQEKVLQGTWKKTLTYTKGIDISELAESLSFPIDLPDGLVIPLTSILLKYNATKKEFIIVAATDSYGELRYVSVRDKFGKVNSIIEIDLNKNKPNLSSMSFLGNTAQSIVPSASRIIVSNSQFDNVNVNVDDKNISYQSLIKAVYFGAQFDGKILGNVLIPIYPASALKQHMRSNNYLASSNPSSQQTNNNNNLNQYQGQNTNQNQGLQNNNSYPVQQGLSGHPTGLSHQNSQSGGSYINIAKRLGPLYLARIGAAYSSGKLNFMIDASLFIGPVSVELQGLTMKSPLKEFSPEISLNGLGVGYNSPVFTLSGSISKVPVKPPVVSQYDGMLLMQIRNLSIACLASYRTIKEENGEEYNSMFVFIDMRTVPIPLVCPFFNFTGMLGGFGYNLDLRMPTINEVDSFPFVQGMSPDYSLGRNPMDVLNSMNQTQSWLSNKKGSYWLALGINFDSFKLIYSSVAMFVKFGNDTRFVIVGTSKARFPQYGPVALAYIELGLLAELKPQEGELKVLGLLSSKSFLFDVNAKITGGFALCSWFGNSPHKGDFVFTIGGYHPDFKKPAHYPDVPRLGLNWQISNMISVKGGVYFAVTPAAMMAGINLDLSFQAGKLKAWFIADANFLMYWKPFSFKAHVSVSIGVSYTVSMAFVSKTFKVELGAALDLWGPPTGGKARINWTIISFDIEFGNKPASQKKILEWKEFQELLPEPGTSTKISLVNGLLSKYKKDNEEVMFVRKDNVSFDVTSDIPLTGIYADRSQNESKLVDKGDKFSIKPMKKNGLNSNLNITVTKGSDIIDVDQEGWSFSGIYNNVPESLWGDENQSGTLLSDGLKKDQLLGIHVVSPEAKKGYSPGSLDVNRQLEYIDLNFKGIVPIPVKSEIKESITVSTQRIKDTVISNAKRERLFSVLKIINPELKSDDLTSFAEQVPVIFQDTPISFSA